MTKFFRPRARELWPEAYRIGGEGRFANVAHCRVLTIDLYESRAEAKAAKEAIDSAGCGDPCLCDHEIIDMEDMA